MDETTDDFLIGLPRMFNTITAGQQGRNFQLNVVCPKCEISPATGSYHLVLGGDQEQ